MYVEIKIFEYTRDVQIKVMAIFSTLKRIYKLCSVQSEDLDISDIISDIRSLIKGLNMFKIVATLRVILTCFR